MLRPKFFYRGWCGQGKTKGPILRARWCKAYLYSPVDGSLGYSYHHTEHRACFFMEGNFALGQRITEWRKFLARTRGTFRVSAPPCLTSLTDGKAQIQSTSQTLRTQPSGAATTNAVRGQLAQSSCSWRYRAKIRPQKAGTKWDTCMTHFTVSPGAFVLSNKSSRPSFDGWMRGLFGSLGSDEMRKTIAGFGRGMLD